MCRENVTIAQCAPLDPPVLSFTCGKLHMVAQDRVVCEKAEGKCVCYFGTCGLVTREVTTSGVDLGNIVKIRCATCVVREDNVGDRRSGREILESPLLERPAIGKTGKENYARLLNSLWRGKSACPYHSEDMSEFSISHAINDKSVDTPAQTEVVIQPAAEAAVNEPFSVDTHAIKTHAVDTPAFDAPAFDASPEEHSDATTAIDAASVGSVQAETAETASAEPIDTEPADTELVTAVDEWTVDPAPATEHNKDAAAEPTSDSGIKNGLEREIGIETSRWAPPKSSDPVAEGQGQEKVQDDESSNTKPRRIPTANFAYDPNNADKLRDVTQKLASLKSQFLLGKAF
ncbi:uncharacterized protein FTOL_00346 [Fusarium torulosum]|uniref:Uncharacterized protein n=1 Tax=Fusarium torulosum TaxID=33205 RepID=A0AAE8SC53_9HYPO|nr:uncharacterized protein FTOL_00346 [Fusarium torulosum]